MTVDEFRRHKYLPSQWAKELATNGILQLVLGLMEENHPARFVVQPDNNGDITPTRAALELGMTRGYSKFGDTLKLLARPKAIMPDPGPSTYEAPPKPKEVTL